LINSIEAGASGVISQEADVDELLLAMRNIGEHGFYVGEGMHRAMGLHLHLRNSSLKRGSKTLAFSDKEIQGIKLLSEEFTTLEIAAKLFMSPRTVEGYRLKLVHQVGAKSTVGLLLYAIRNGIVGLVSSREKAFA